MKEPPIAPIVDIIDPRGRRRTLTYFCRPGRTWLRTLRAGARMPAIDELLPCLGAPHRSEQAELRHAKNECRHKAYSSGTHARSVACARRSLWQLGCQQRMLVHVLEARRRLPRTARGKQTGATKHRQ